MVLRVMGYTSAARHGTRFEVGVDVDFSLRNDRDGTETPLLSNTDKLKEECTDASMLRKIGNCFYKSLGVSIAREG